jgi:diacylglycerol kinase (ATP)
MTRFSQVALIQNPASGNGGEPPRLAVRNELAAAGCLWKELVVEPDRSIAIRTSELLLEGVDLIVVAGGDGTVREVASTLVGKPVPLLIIPLGTFNNFARSLSLPFDPIGACQLVHTGALRQVDVGTANGQHLFFEAAGVGVDAQLFPLGEAVKQGRLAAIWIIVSRCFSRFQQARTAISFFVNQSR